MVNAADFFFQGSTCAFTERILRNYGLKTGFYRWAPRWLLGDGFRVLSGTPGRVEWGSCPGC